MTAAMTTTTETALPTTLEWSIDPAHTQVGFSVKHLMITNVKGRFPQVSGTVGLDPATSQPEVDVSIDANSITTGDPKRDAHLRSADFLHADKHPTLQFRATRLDGNVDTKFTLDGDLTIRGVTRPVTLMSSLRVAPMIRGETPRQVTPRRPTSAARILDSSGTWPSKPAASWWAMT